MNIDLNKVRSINPESNSNFYCDRDLLNNKLTWRLYKTGGTDIILRGFHELNGKFSITNLYSNGLGNYLANEAILRIRDGLREIGRRGRDLYTYRNEIGGILDNLKNKVTGGLESAINFGLDLYDKKSETGSESARNIISDVSNSIKEYDIAKNWEGALKRSSTIGQGEKSKLYDQTQVSIPDISSLSCRIWTESKELSCDKIIKDLYTEYFIGDFKLTGYENGLGYWTAPNNLDLAEDNPLDPSKSIPGSFTLHIGQYQFTNLLIESFSWEYSREYARVVDQSGNLVTIEHPAYADCVLNLTTGKFITKSYLDSTFVPTKL